MKKQLSKYSGFTLIELMLVIALIAILIAASVPTYQKYTKKAHYIEIINSVAPFKLEVAECYLMQGELAKCKSGMHGIHREFNGSNLIKNITVMAHGVIIATPNNLYGIKENDDYILTPTPNNNGLIWHATGGGVDAGYTY